MKITGDIEAMKKFNITPRGVTSISIQQVQGPSLLKSCLNSAPPF